MLESINVTVKDVEHNRTDLRNTSNEDVNDPTDTVSLMNTQR